MACSKLLLFLAVTATLPSCSAIRSFRMPGATENLAGSGNAYAHDTVIRTSIWKGKNNSDITCNCTHGISRFKVTTKPGDVLLGTLTLGLRVRQRVEWDCAQRRGIDIPD